MNICGSFPARPVVKVRIWTSKDEHETRVFVGRNKAAASVLLKIERDPQYVQMMTDADKGVLHNTYGQNWRNKLGLKLNEKVRFIHETVYDDDSVSVLFKKLCMYAFDNVTENQVCAWGERGIKNNDDFRFRLVTNIMKGKSVVEAEAVIKVLDTLFGSHGTLESNGRCTFDDVSRELQQMKPHSINTSIGWKFVSGDYDEHLQNNPFLLGSDDDVPNAFDVEAISELPLTLESYNLEGRVVNAALYDRVAEQSTKKVVASSLPLYFPMRATSQEKQTDQTLYTQVEDIHHSVQDYLGKPDAFGVSCHVGYVHLRVNETSLNANINLLELFNRLETSTWIPFIKYNTSSNKTYKVDKMSLSPKGLARIDKNDFDKWVESNPADVKTKSAFEYIMFKVFVRKSNNINIFATILVFEDTHVDVKYNIRSVDKVTFGDVSKSFGLVNTVLDSVDSLTSADIHFPRIDPNYWTRYMMLPEVKLINMSTTIKVAAPNAKKEDRGTLRTLVEKLFPYFNIIDMGKAQQQDGSVSFQYKRIDNFVKQTNISIFLNQQLSASNEEKVAALQKQFAGMSKKDAENHVDVWQTSLKFERVNIGKSTYFKPFSANCLLIRVGQNELGYSVQVNGITNVKYHQRILGLLKYTFAHRNKSEALPFLKDNLNADANLYDADIAFPPAVNNAEADNPDLPDISQSESELNGLEDDDSDFDMFDLDDILEKVKNAEAQPGPSKPSGLVDDADVQIQELKRQLEAEEKVNGKQKRQAFQYVLNRLKLADRVLFSDEYSKKCQWSQKRQPIVISNEEKAQIDKLFPGSYNNFVEYQRTREEKKNIYICPEVWCPISKVSMSFEQFAAAGNMCPGGKNEPVINMENNYFKKGDTGSNVPRYVAFSGDQNKCLPCCFKINPNKLSKIPSENQKKFIECTQDLESVGAPGPSVFVDQIDRKYVLGPQYPLDTERFGSLPEVLAGVFQNARFGRTGNGGSLSDGDNVFVRYGIAGHQQSFLSCLNTMLLGGVEKDMVALLERHVTLRQFLIVNNGALFDMFLDPSRTLWDGEEFDAFCRWFIDGKLKNRKEDRLKSIVEPYIYGFKLLKVRTALLDFHINRQQHGEKYSYNHDLRKHKEFKHILREYLVFNSYSNFLAYLHDDSVQKQHDVLLDLFNRQGNDVVDINPKGYNIILFEVEQGQIYINCPFESQQTLDLTNPFVFMLKQDAFYEPIGRISLSKKVFSHNQSFRYEEDSIVHELVDFYRQRCKTSKKMAASGSSVFKYLTSIGRKVQHQVINYNYKLVGFLVRNKASDDNVFVPCKPQTPVFIRNASYVYVDDIISRIKKIDVQEAKELFKQLYDLTKTPDDPNDTQADVYKVAKVVKSNDGSGEAIGLTMVDGTFIPLCKDLVPQERYLDNLNIFIGWEENDPRKIYVDSEHTKEMLYRILKNEISRVIPKIFDKETRTKLVMDDVEFLLADDNPMPMWLKRKKMASIVDTFLRKLVLVESAEDQENLEVDKPSCQDLRKTKCNGICKWSTQSNTCAIRVPEVWLKQFKDKIAEALLTRPRKMETIQLTSEKNRPSSQLVFEQRDVLTGKITQIHDVLMNPYVFVDKVIDNFLAKTLEGRFDVKRSVSVTTLLTGEYIRLPTSFNKLFNRKTNEKVSDEDMWINERPETEKRHDFIFDVFYIVGKLMNSRTKMRKDIFSKLVHNRLIEDIKDIGEKEMIDYLRAYNTQVNFRMSKEGGNMLKTMEDIQAFMLDEKRYYMSEYELGIVARILQINIIIIGRKTLRNPNSMKCISPINKSTSYLILHSKEYVDKKRGRAHDVYSVVVKDIHKPQVVFNEADLNDHALEYIRENCKTIHVIINE